MRGGTAHLPAGDLNGDTASGLRRFLFASPLYRYTFVGRKPSRLLGTPPEIWPGDKIKGAELCRGEFVFAGASRRLDNLSAPLSDAGPDWLAELHGFSWLTHLRALASGEARRFAARSVDDWIETHGEWDRFSWRPEILGERLANLLIHFAFFSAEADEDFNRRFFSSVSIQARHLARAVSSGAGGEPRFRAIKGLIYSGLSLPDHDKHLYKGLGLLASETAAQVFADGGHISRNPSRQADVLCHLLCIREALAAAHVEAPAWLADAIGRMVPMLRACRLGDGGLAQFNGGGAGDADVLDTVIAKSGVRGKARQSARQSGFFRLAAGRTILVIDGGGNPPPDAWTWGHAGTLSFEMSTGKQRLVVNCGAHLRGEWRHALRATAAHSTLVVDDVNSSEINRRGGFFRGPNTVIANRRELDGDTTVESRHDGYETAFGLTHRRVITLSGDGNEVAGEDRLLGTGGDSFVLRFHLHPDVQASLVGDAASVLVKIPRAKGWSFRATGGVVAIDDSVYFGDGAMKRCRQITVSGRLSGQGAVIAWRLARLDQ